uniref:Uncharacterized protein n=1 Tax=Romanomermis culicivorax TaxID=13658 RepID=A0A915IPM3_ROMCU
MDCNNEQQEDFDDEDGFGIGSKSGKYLDNGLDDATNSSQDFDLEYFILKQMVELTQVLDVNSDPASLSKLRHKVFLILLSDAAKCLGEISKYYAKGTIIVHTEEQHHTAIHAVDKAAQQEEPVHLRCYGKDEFMLILHNG